MKIKSEDEIVDQLAKLYDSKFDGRKAGSFRLQSDKFREFTGRTRLESGVRKRIGVALLGQVQKFL